MDVDEELVKVRQRVKTLATKFNERESKSSRQRATEANLEKEVERLQELVAQAQQAKLEALEYTTHGRAELVDEVKRLRGILLEAKLEAEAKDAEVDALHSKIETLHARYDILETQATLERQRFAAVIANDMSS